MDSQNSRRDTRLFAGVARLLRADSPTLKRVAERFTDWLASPLALLQAIIITLPWLVVVAVGWDPHGFWFLFFATLISFLTQFPLAYASRRSEEHMLKMMRLMVALAEEIKSGQDEQDSTLNRLLGVTDVGDGPVSGPE